ncbi:MAG: hypothetical protein JWN36_186, partial [Microbacteriaceae bacterium]|nr:hypothetical protein [Microbacteriaceae bacterium]
GGVAEAYGVQEITGYSTSVAQENAATDPLFAHVPADDSTPSLAPVITSPADIPVAVAPSVLPRLGGTQLLQQLTLLKGSQLATFVKDNPSAIHKLIVSPPKASAVVTLWSGMSKAEQNEFARTVPQLAGNLDGLPYSVRDRANRAYLATSIKAAEKSISAGVGRAALVDKRHHLEILKQIERTLDAKKSAAPRQLVTFDPTGDARAAVVVGDLQTADYVSYLVPGMFFTVQGQMYDWTVISQDLYTQQKAWLKRLAAADPSYAGKTAATVSWIGYSTPGVLDIASLTRADQGASFLGSAVQGVQATRKGNEPYVTLITHSYGSTAAMIELQKGGVKVDALALIGSPGSSAQKASALDVRNDNVFVGEAAWDPVVNTAFYGSDPGSASFGAKTMDVSGTTDAITHKKLAAAVGHLGYFDKDTEAMRNLSLIGLGQGQLVTDGTQADASRTLASLK